MRIGLEKAAHFVSIYPYPLTNNEWHVKFPVGDKSTCNPDYFCPRTGFYIEVATTKQNISQQDWKWRELLNRGIRLKVFWWEGEEITNKFLGDRKYI